MADPNPNRSDDLAQRSVSDRPQAAADPALPSAGRRRLLRGAASGVPVMMTLASGAALAQASAARRAVVADPLVNGNKAFGYRDNAPPGLDGNDQAFGFQTRNDDTICIQDSLITGGSPDPTNRYTFSDGRVQNTVPIPPENTAGNVVLITDSSWASLDPASGGTCQGTAVEPLSPLRVRSPDQSLGEPATGFFPGQGN